MALPTCPKCKRAVSPPNALSCPHCGKIYDHALQDNTIYHQQLHPKVPDIKSNTNRNNTAISIKYVMLILVIITLIISAIVDNVNDPDKKWEKWFALACITPTSSMAGTYYDSNSTWRLQPDGTAVISFNGITYVSHGTWGQEGSAVNISLGDMTFYGVMDNNGGIYLGRCFDSGTDPVIDCHLKKVTE